MTEDDIATELSTLDDGLVTYGTFVIDGDEYALPAAEIREVVQLPASLSPLHGTAKHVVGMFRLRDEVIPVVDTQCLLTGDVSPMSQDPRVAIVDAGSHIFGAIFDSTGEVLRLEPRDVRTLDGCGDIIKGMLCTNNTDRLVTVLSADSFGNTPKFPKQESHDDGPALQAEEASVQHILVRIDQLVLAIPTHQALEVHTTMPVRNTIPYFDHCVGLVELRNESVSLLDLRLALGHGASNGTDRLVFIHNGTVVLAVPVDEVLEVIEAPPSQIRDVALIDQLPSASFCSQVISRPGSRDAYCLDVAKLFETCRVNPECPEGMGRGLLGNSDIVEQTDRYYLTFQLGKATFGVEMTDVREICTMPELTPTLAPDTAIEGLMNIRGDIIPVLDLRVRYGLQHDETTADSRVIVLDVDGRPYGLSVDALGDILSSDATSSYGPPPKTIASGDGPLRRAMPDVRELLQARVGDSEQLLLVLNPHAILAKSIPPDSEGNISSS